MNRKIVLVVLAVVFMASVAWAAGDSTGKGAAMTGSGLVIKGKVAITQLLVDTDGSNDVTVAAYNNGSAGSGDQITSWTCTGAAKTCAQDWPTPRYCDKGIWIVVTTSGTANVYPEWQPR